MESDEDTAGELILPDIPTQSRTLLHYFSKLKSHKQESGISSQPKNNDKSLKKSEETSKDIDINSEVHSVPFEKTSKSDQTKVESTLNTNNKEDEISSTAASTKKVQKGCVEKNKATVEGIIENSRKKSKPSQNSNNQGDRISSVKIVNKKKEKRSTEKKKDPVDATSKKSQNNLENTPNLECNEHPLSSDTTVKKKKQKRCIEKIKEVVEASENLPSSKRIRSEELPESSVKDDNHLSEEKSIKGINSFFKTVSKNEFRKECAKQAEKIKLTVTAMVHTPSMSAHGDNQSLEGVNTPKQNIISNPSMEQIPKEIRRRKCSFTNVIRPNSETDLIKVIAQEEIRTENRDNTKNNSDEAILKDETPRKNTDTTIFVQKDTDEAPQLAMERKIVSPNFNENSQTIISQNKVSDKLFRRKRKKQKSIPDSKDANDQRKIETARVTDDSVDVDFFSIQTTLINEKGFTSDEEVVDVLNRPLCSTIEFDPDDLALSSPPAKLCDVNEEQIVSPKKKAAKLSSQSTEKNINTPKKQSQVRKKGSFFCNSKLLNECKTSEEILLSSEKITQSDKLICTSDRHDKAPDKTPAPICLFKNKEPPKRKYGKRAKASVKTNAVDGTAHTNYDSDSIDLDLLSTYNAKTFHSAASGENGSNNCGLGKISKNVLIDNKWCFTNQMFESR